LKEQAPEAEKGFSMLTAALKKKISAHVKTEKKRRVSAERTRTRKNKAKIIKARKKRG